MNRPVPKAQREMITLSIGTGSVISDVRSPRHQIVSRLVSVAVGK
jgi:hypothetical protein